MPTIGCGILTMNKEAAILDRALASVAKHVDRIYITVADREEPTDEIKQIAEKYGADLSFFQWENRYDEPGFSIDFAAARNFNMSRCKEEWYTWLDTDDEVEGMELAKDHLAKVPPHIKFALCVYNYAFFPSGKVDNAHPKERFMRMEEGFEWKGALHENCITAHRVDGIRFEDIVWNHRSDNERTANSCFRNIKVVEKELAEQIEEKEKDETKKLDPRTVFNLGMAYSSYAQKTDKEEDWEASIKAFHKYLEMSGWDNHAYMAWRFIGNAFIRLGRPHLALPAYFECLKISPNFRDAYASLGSAYLQMNDKERAKHWFKLALLAGEENNYIADLRTSLLNPLLSLAEIYATEGKLDDAEKFLLFAIEETKIDDENVNSMLAYIRETKAWLLETKTERKRLEDLPEEEQKAAFDALPQKMKSAPELIAFRRLKKWKTGTSGKEITIHTGIGWEEWSPESAKTGIGGSEEAVINMAKELLHLGWNVTVYGNHGLEAEEHDGVWYRPYWEWSPEEETDIFIGWRDPTLFDLPIKAKKTYLWLHDTNPESSLTEKRLAKIDKIFVLSKYHRSLYPNTPDEKMFISSNGILPEQFEQTVVKNPKKCMYVSAPNRGLQCLLDLWPKIKAQVPDVELYWAYGWNTYDIMMRTNPTARKFKEDCLKKMEGLEGFHDLGRIGHEDLARHMLESGVWLYPTEFTEIFCISAIKAQAAGMIPVTTRVAALDETVQFGTKLSCDNIYSNKEAQDEFVRQTVLALTNGKEREKMVEWARSHFAWSRVAEEWDRDFRL